MIDENVNSGALMKPDVALVETVVKLHGIVSCKQIVPFSDTSLHKAF